MDNQHKEILRSQLVYIGQNLVIDDTFLDYMESNRVVTDSMREEIEAAATKSKRNSQFMALLKRRGPNAFKTFIYALMETDQDFIAERLHPGYVQEWQQRKGTAASRQHGFQETGVKLGLDVTYNRAESDEESEEEGIDMKSTGLMDIKVRHVNPEDRASCKDFLTPSQNVYKMNSKKRGRALIINNRDFLNNIRHGTDIDATNMDILLTELAYDVVTKENLSSFEIRQVLSDESQSKDHEICDSFICVILSHGGVNTVFGVDNEEVTVDDITTYFDNKRCHALAGKPKLFIIQACQGTDYDHGVYTLEGTDSEPSSESPEKKPDSSSSIANVTKKLDKMNINESKLPSKGDTLIAFPTHTGYRSWRHGELGSWFIRAIVEVFMKYSYKYHVDDLMKKVKRKIAKTGTISHADPYKQMPEDRSSLQKNMYFFPGLSLSDDASAQIGNTAHPTDN